MKHPCKGTVFITGAGPGDPSVLTVRAADVLGMADVVLHDALVTEEILALAGSNAELVNVGKRLADGQNQTRRQERINGLLVEHASAGCLVVRLKAGDPFMFGRGIEEVRALSDAGIPYEVVPGITAGIAAADLFSIPLTERYRNTAAIFCTGHTASHSSAHFQAFIELMKAGTPLVMYMGLDTLMPILARMKASGLPDSLGVCAVSRVSRPDQKLVYGTLSTIAAMLRDRPLQLPVVFIIGEYARPEFADSGSFFQFPHIE